jgi:WD40 repeat protein
MPYDLARLQRDIAQIQHDDAGFGTGRLVAENLILTAAHPLWNKDDGTGPFLDGWQVRLARDRGAGPWRFRRGNRVVWRDQAGDLALIQLVDPEGGPLRPELRLRVATVLGNNPHAVEARGYPRASKQAEGPRDLTPALGRLTAADRDRPLRFGVDYSDLPNEPHADWPGMSGSAVLLQDWSDLDEIWVYGVVREVPANFDGQLRITRLTDAWQDTTFRSLLVAAGAPDKNAEDPTSAASAPIFYNLPSLPDRYQRREADINETCAKVLGASAAVGITSAARAFGLHGMGGIGKTVLATALVHNPELRAAFPDGIAWLTFGRTVPILAKAVEFARALTSKETSYNTVTEARGQLGLYTANSRLLVVLDDVWEPEAVDPFTGLGAGCHLLITTRSIRVLERARADRHQLDLLEPASARAFLAEATGIAVEALPVEADQIVRECGRLPLALAAVGALMRRGTFDWTDALTALRERALGHLDTSWLPDPEQRSLAVVLKLSVDALGEDVRTCFLDCAAFREGVDIPEKALLRLWSDRVADELGRKRFAQELVDRSLMRRDEQRRYRIHDLYVDYLRHATAPLIDRHRHLIEHYRSALPGGLANCPDDGYCVQHIAWHLREADESAELRLLLFDLVWIRRKLNTAGVHALLEDYELLVEDREASQLAAALTLSAHVLGPNPDHLEVQLRGRLVGEDGPAITQLLAALRETRPAPFAPIRGRYLTRPGPLLRTIPVGDWVWTVAVLPDGRRALSGSMDRTLRLWDLDTGAELRRFEGHSDPVRAVAVLPDGRRALSSSSDGTLRLWDLETGAELRRFEGHSKAVMTVAVLADGRCALSSSSDGTLRLWDIETGTELRRFEGHSKAVMTVAVLADGRCALSSSSDGTLRLWDIEAGVELRRFEGNGAVTAVAVLADGHRALSGCGDGTLRLWDLETGAELRRFEANHIGVATVALLMDGRRALSGYYGPTMRLWDLETGAELRRFEEHGEGVITVAVLPDGRRALSGSWDRTLRLWNLETGAEPRRFAGHGDQVMTVTMLAEGRRALSGSKDQTLRLWDLETGAELRRFEGHSKAVMTVAALADGRCALSGSSDGTLRLWDIETGAELRRFEAHGEAVTTVAVLADGHRALSGSDNYTLRLWDLETGAELQRFERRGYDAETLALLADGRRALSGSSDEKGLRFTGPSDGTLRLWDIETGAELRRFDGHGDAVTMVLALADGRRALSGSRDHTLRLWDLETGAELRRFEGHREAVTTVAVLADGRRALSGSEDRTLRLWDIETGAELRRFEGHGNWVMKVAVLADGRRALSICGDHTLRLWELETSVELACFIGDETMVTVAVSPIGDRAIVGDARGRVMVFAVPL